MAEHYIAPSVMADAFTCPQCGAFAQQLWKHIHTDQQKAEVVGGIGTRVTWKVHAAQCTRCERTSYWLDKLMIFPLTGGAPPPAADMPDDVRADYQEARAIVRMSPRGAAGLLRLAIQKLCKHLGEPGEDLNTDIGSLVKKGLPPRIQQALDAVRVIGNESVHPGTIDLRADPKTTLAIFSLVNQIINAMITQPKETQAIYDALPERKLKGIADRDKKAREAAGNP